MDNINVIRVGFNIPGFKLSDTKGDMADPVNRSGDMLTLLIFANPDDSGSEFIKNIESDLPATRGGLPLELAVVVPVKIKPAKQFKDSSEITARVFCDYDLRIGRQFSVIDSASARPAYHQAAFVIEGDGTVRYRQAHTAEGFNYDLFKASLRELI
jgi:peroxiredoxin